MDDHSDPERKVVVESAGLTDIGRKRKNNEDAFFVDNDLGLYLLADGMGGHQAGEVASDLVVKTIRSHMQRFHAGGDEEEFVDFDDTLTSQANRIRSSILLANQSVYQLAQSKDGFHGMGSTVASVYLAEDRLIVANVGDSPVYLVHDGRIELASFIHNVISEQSVWDPDAANRLSEDVKYLLTRAMGVQETVKPDISEFPCFPGDVAIICSDGLSDLVSPEEIQEAVANERLDRACRKLVDAANARGGHDNITLILIRVKEVLRNKDVFSRMTSWTARRLIRILERFV